MYAGFAFEGYYLGFGFVGCDFLGQSIDDPSDVHDQEPFDECIRLVRVEARAGRHGDESESTERFFSRAGLILIILIYYSQQS
jgi:hypothetical protein